HRGSFAGDDDPTSGLATVDLVRAIRTTTQVPGVAAGGIGTPHDVVGVLDAGAIAAQAGTALLRCSESGAHPAHKAALLDPAYPGTGFTRSFSGRYARGLRNRFMESHPAAPAAYSEINN